jgi:hypothetical protein
LERLLERNIYLVASCPAEHRAAHGGPHLDQSADQLLGRPGHVRGSDWGGGHGLDDTGRHLYFLLSVPARVSWYQV